MIATQQNKTINPEAYLSIDEIVKAFDIAEAWGIPVFRAGNLVVKSVTSEGVVTHFDGSTFALQKEYPYFTIGGNYILSSILMDQVPFPSAKHEVLGDFVLFQRIRIHTDIGMPHFPSSILMNKGCLKSIVSGNYFSDKTSLVTDVDGNEIWGNHKLEDIIEGLRN